MAEARRALVLSTYRLQVHRDFTFDDVRAVAPYLARLGVTHLYLSPITMAAPGSMHGYDVVDPTRLNPELGGEEAYARLVEEQRRLGLGQVVDIVPNHMGIAAGSGNAYWDDLLRRGPASPSARIFDIEWNSEDPELRRHVMLPILGRDVDEVIERGELALEFNEDGGWLRYYDFRLPLRAESVEALRARESSAALSRVDWRELLEEQHYRLEFWRSAKKSLNYRRFFAIDELIGIRAEDPEVFELTHDLVLRLVEEGAVDGLRVDHPDGLHDPEGYLAQLRSALNATGLLDGYVVIEKILAAGEPLPPSWDCAGTTGYDFMNEVTRVLIDPAAAARLTSTYQRLAGRTEAYASIEDACRVDVLRGDLEEQFTRQAQRLYDRLPEVGHVDGDTFVEALLALLARFDVYRTYHRRDAVDPLAGEIVARAREGARADDAAPADALALAAEALIAPAEGPPREVVLRLQQIMPAVQAKGLEDRAFYRYRRLLALNEVGGDPGTFGETAEVFHERMAEAATRWPGRMLATATHDHKRGEDVRARLAALSEFPDEWDVSAERALARLETMQDGAARRVHPADAYLVLQTLVGCHPWGMTPARGDGSELAGRLGDYALKALREAAEHTDWIDGDEEYEGNVMDLARRAATDEEIGRGLAALLDRLAPAGAVRSLAQTVLKVAGPGVPDTYQGNELWDFSLVDPDNRRPIDFQRRVALLDEFGTAIGGGRAVDAERGDLAASLLGRWRDGAVKAYVLARALHVRRARPSTLLGGAYEPLAVEGERAHEVLAFARHGEAGSAVVVAPIRSRRTSTPDGLWAPEWGDTVVWSPRAVGESWRDAFTGAAVVGGDALALRDVLGSFPVALLIAGDA